MDFHNTYEDARRATAYDQLDWAGTYSLVLRDLPRLVREHATGHRAVDFGCGTGRSSRLLASLGYRTIGVDISAEMVEIARRRDTEGDYRVIEDGDFSSLEAGAFDLVLSAFTFDNVPGRERKVHLFTGLGKLLRPGGRMVNVVCTPEIYVHEWVTFSTRDHPENRSARCGDVVHIVTTDYEDARPVPDILWPDEDYRDVYRAAGLEVERFETPLATGREGIAWVSETRIPPWGLYVLRPAGATP